MGCAEQLRCLQPLRAPGSVGRAALTATEHNYRVIILLYLSDCVVVLFVWYSGLFINLITVSFHELGPGPGGADRFFKIT